MGNIGALPGFRGSRYPTLRGGRGGRQDGFCSWRCCRPSRDAIIRSGGSSAAIASPLDGESKHNSAEVMVPDVGRRRRGAGTSSSGHRMRVRRASVDRH